MVHRTQQISDRAYELAALSGAGASVIGLGIGMLAAKPGVGAVVGAGAGLLLRAAILARALRSLDAKS